jgi:glycosyltransferase involved in cell wall biosynthesis
MQFSGEINEVGKFKISKLIHMVKVIVEVFYSKYRYGIDTVYYMPTGAKWVPLIRDIIILLAVRWLFDKTIFHFRSAGVANLYPRLHPFFKYLYRKAYYYPDLGIKLSKYNPADDIALKCKQSVVVHNGVEDYFITYSHLKKNSTTPTILFVGVIQESKGVFELLEIARRLHSQKIVFELRLVGKADSDSTENRIRQYINKYQLHNQIKLVGVKVGKDKWQEYVNADVFCFPSHFETFGLVLVEAMQFSVPVVATQVGGIQSVVVDEETGYLAPLRDITAFTEKIKKLLLDSSLRKHMGCRGREYFLQNFTVEQYWHNMERALSQKI